MKRDEFWLKWDKIFNYFMIGVAVKMPESKTIFKGDVFD